MKQYLFMLALISFLPAVELNLDVEGIVDNREYFNEFEDDGTTFGLRQTATATMEIDSHSVTGGISWLQEFGSPVENWLTAPILFYRYNGEKGGRLLFGSFPRTNNLLSSPVFFDTRYTTFRPQIEGFDFRYNFAKGAISAWVDWDGKQTSTVQEAFFVGLSGKQQFGKFSIEEYWHYRHIASRDIPVHDTIREQGGAHLILSFEENNIPVLDTLKVTAELIASYDHPTRQESWNNPTGMQVTARTIFHRLGIGGKVYHEILSDKKHHQGDHQAPFYNTGHFGSVDLAFYPVQKEKITMRFNWITTFVGGVTENEQHFVVDGSFGKSIKKHRESK